MQSLRLLLHLSLNEFLRALLETWVSLEVVVVVRQRIQQNRRLCALDVSIGSHLSGGGSGDGGVCRLQCNRGRCYRRGACFARRRSANFVSASPETLPTYHHSQRPCPSAWPSEPAGSSNSCLLVRSLPSPPSRLPAESTPRRPRKVRA